MNQLLDVLKEHAVHVGDDVELGWEVTVNAFVVRVEAATREVFDHREQAWEASLALRQRLVDAVGVPRTDDVVRVITRPEGAHSDDYPLEGYRGAVKVVWPVSVLGPGLSADE